MTSAITNSAVSSFSLEDIVKIAAHLVRAPAQRGELKPRQLRQ